MGFLDSVKGIADKVTDKVGSGVSSAVDGSKKLNEKFKLKNELKAEENEMLKAFAEIGKKFYEANSANPSGDYVELINAVTEKKTKVEALKEKLSVLEDKTFCPECNAELEKNAKFCAKCGAKIEAAPVPEVEAEVVEESEEKSESNE